MLGNEYIHFSLINNIIDSFKSNATLTNFFTTVLQTIELANSYGFASRPIIYIIFFIYQ